MTSFRIDARLRLAIELALTADHPDQSLRARQDADARRLGMSGADIDAARRGWSFDVRTSLALALAISLRCDKEEWRIRRDRAMAAGIAEAVCREIESVSRSVPAPTGDPDESP